MENEKLPTYFEQLIQKFWPHMQNGLNSPAGLSPAAFVGNSETGEICVVGLSFPTDAAKDECAGSIRDLARTIGADFVIFVSESSAVEPTTKTKTECVLMTIETKTSDWLAQLPLGPDKVLGAAVVFRRTEPTGRFTHFLGPKAVLN